MLIHLCQWWTSCLFCILLIILGINLTIYDIRHYVNYIDISWAVWYQICSCIYIMFWIYVLCNFFALWQINIWTLLQSPLRKFFCKVGRRIDSVLIEHMALLCWCMSGLKRASMPGGTNFSLEFILVCTDYLLILFT